MFHDWGWTTHTLQWKSPLGAKFINFLWMKLSQIVYSNIIIYNTCDKMFWVACKMLVVWTVGERGGHKHRINDVGPFLLTQPLASLGHTSSPLTDKRNKDHSTTYLSTMATQLHQKSLYSCLTMAWLSHIYTSLFGTQWVWLYVSILDLVVWVFSENFFVLSTEKKENIQ